ncbi:hypothetical protein [Leyella stercorea]|uniref:hypothetical protein n=1 Tax=Leyella stercorea TaxID=363265 RepID=UPI003F81E2C0
MRTSASTDADVCADRCACLRRPMRMSASTDAHGNSSRISTENISKPHHNEEILTLESTQ